MAVTKMDVTKVAVTKAELKCGQPGLQHTHCIYNTTQHIHNLAGRGRSRCERFCLLFLSLSLSLSLSFSIASIMSHNRAAAPQIDPLTSAPSIMSHNRAAAPQIDPLTSAPSLASPSTLSSRRHRGIVTGSPLAQSTVSA